MKTQCLDEQLPRGHKTADSGDLVFNLVQILEKAKFERDSDREDAKASIAKVSALLGLDLLPIPTISAQPVSCGGLAQWQVVRLLEFIDRRIDRNVSITELSQYVRLSPSHFARAFKKTFQETPHAFVVRRRVAYAKYLLVSSIIPLHEIALNCGFSDQAHLCKAFRKHVGQTPASWRRQRRQIISTTYHGFGEIEPG